MRYTVLALALAVTAITARADAAGGPLAVQTMTLKGRCDQLEIPEIIKREIPKTVTTENCIGTLISLSSADGQILFSFVTKDGVTISFAGLNQTKPDSNSAVLSLETVTVRVEEIINHLQRERRLPICESLQRANENQLPRGDTSRRLRW